MKYAELTKNKQCEELMMQTMHKMKDAFYKIYIAVLKKTIHYSRKRFEEMRAAIEGEVATLARSVRSHAMLTSILVTSQCSTSVLFGLTGG